MKGFSITVSKDGALVVKGNVSLRRATITPVGGHYEYAFGEKLEHGETFSLCRCGHSGNPPFCDGAHRKAGFDGTQNPPSGSFALRAKRYEGADLTLLDDYDLCALARFCHTERGDIWSMMAHADDPAVRAEIVKAAESCPAARLAIEGRQVRYPDEIVVLEDPQRHCSGPLWARGDFTLTLSDGRVYEKSAKCTLCRCGRSAIKPFCDAEHAFSHWRESPKRAVEPSG